MTAKLTVIFAMLLTLGYVIYQGVVGGKYIVIGALFLLAETIVLSLLPTKKK